MKKRIILLTAVLTIIFAFGGRAPAAAGGAAITVGGASGAAGETVEVVISLENNTGFANLGIEIWYDVNALTLVNATNAPGVGGMFTAAEHIDKLPYNMAWTNAGNIAYNGVLATLEFEIAGQAAAGNYSVAVDYYKGRDGNYIDGVNVNYDEDREPINLQYQDGEIVVAGEETALDTTITLISTYYMINVEVINPSENGKIFVAFYDASDKLIMVTSEDYTMGQGVSPMILPRPNGAAYAKTMLWGTLENCRPICPFKITGL